MQNTKSTKSIVNSKSKSIVNSKSKSKKDGQTGQEPRYRVAGVPRPRTLSGLAKSVEKVLNDLGEAGYGYPGIYDVGGGVLVIMEHEREQMQQESPVVSFFRSLGMNVTDVQQSPGETLGPKASELIGRFFTVCHWQHGSVKFEAAVRPHVQKLTSDFSANDLSLVADEYDKVALEHEKIHVDPSCTLPDVLRIAATIVRETAQGKLQ